MVDLKTSALATAIPSDMVIFGADGQDASAPAPYPITLFDARFGGSVSPQVVGAFNYMNSDAGTNEESSIAHYASPILNALYFYAYYDGNFAPNSFGAVRCIATSGTAGSVGTLFRQSSGGFIGLVTVGTGGSSYAHVIEGDSLYLGRFGIDTNGTQVVPQSKFNILVTEATLRRLIMRAGGILLVDAALNFGFAHADMMSTKIFAAPGYVGELAHFGSRTSSSNVGIPITANVYCEGRHDSNNSFTWSPGTQTFDFATTRTCIGLMIQNSNTGMGQFRALLNQLAFGVFHKSNTEKIIGHYTFNDTQLGIIESQTKFEVRRIVRGTSTTIYTQRPHPFIVGDITAYTNLRGLTGLNSGFHTITAVGSDRKSFTISYNSSAQPDHVPYSGHVRHTAVNNSNTTADSNKIIASYQRCFSVLRTGGEGSGFFDLTVESRRDPGWWVLAAYELNATITNTNLTVNPGVVNRKFHGRANGTAVAFLTTGGLPAPLTTGSVYYIVNATRDTFQLAATPGGSAIVTTTTGSGTHTLYYPRSGDVTVSGSTFSRTAHLFEDGSYITLTTTDTLPTGVSSSTYYFIVNATDDTFQVSATLDGTPITLSSAGVGTHTAHVYTPMRNALPVVEHKTGKNCYVILNARGNGGRSLYYVDRDEISGSIGQNDKGIIEITVDDNCEGVVLTVDRANDLTGFCRASETYNSKSWSTFSVGFGIPTPYDIESPSVWLNQIKKSFDVSIHLPRVFAREGIRYGDTSKGLWSTGVTFAPALVHMSGYDAASGAYATAQTALVFEACENCKFSYVSLHGNMTLMSGCQGAEITVPTEWAQYYTATIDPEATATFYLKGTIRLGDILYQSWIRPGINVEVESVSDLGGASLRYRDGRWDTPRAHYVSTAILESITSDINAKYRYAGLQVTASDTNIAYTSVGSAADDDWVSVDGVTTLATPSEQAWTATHVARMSVAPSAPLRNALDKLYFDLDQAGAWTLIRGLWVAQETEADALLNLKSTSYTLTKAGSPTWTANAGWTGKGTTIASVTVTNGGSGYLTPPTVTFAPPSAAGGSGTTATGTAVLTGNAVTSVTITNAGSGYVGVPSCTFSAPPSGTTATGTAVLSAIADYLDTGFSQLVALDGTGQNDFCFGFCAITPSPNSNAHIMGAPNTQRANLNAYGGGVSGYISSNSSTTVTVSSTAPRFTWINRSASTTQDIWDNGVKVVSDDTKTSNGTSGLITVLRAGSSNNVGTNALVGIGFLGKALTSDAMNIAVYRALKAYQQTVAGI